MGCCGSKEATVYPENRSNENILFKKQPNKVQSDEFSFEWDTSEWKQQIEKLQTNKKLEQYALSVKRNQFRTINDLIKFLSNSNCRNDLEKAWLVYFWITHNIDYNTEGFRDGEYGDNESAAVLACGYSVCEGYANLYEDLSKGLGLKCKKISGYCKGFGYEPGTKFTKQNHAWNAVEINNKWYYVESTWGAGSCTNDFKFERKFNPYWFMTPAQIFIHTHYSETLQLQYKKINLHEFEEMPLFDLDFHLFDVQLLSHESSLISSPHRELFIEFSAPKQVLLAASLKEKQTEKEISNSVVVQRDARTQNFCVIALVPEKNKPYKLSIFGKHESNPNMNYTSLTKFLVTRTKDEPNDRIPRYSLEFKPNLRCVSHFGQLVRARTNPLQLNFVSLKQVPLTADLRDEKNEIIANAVLLQKLKDKNEYEIRVILPLSGYLYDLHLFVREEKGSYEKTASFKLIREQDNPSLDTKKFLKKYQVNDNLDYYIYNPVYQLLKKNEDYEFKFFIKNVFKVALVDKESNWFYLESDLQSVWTATQSFQTPGDLTVFYKKTSNDTNFEALCSYFVE